jgi:hypothetical protein
MRRPFSPNDMEFRIMPNGDGRWYWEVLIDRNDVMARGVADFEPDACKQAADAARRAKLIPKS